MVTKIEEAQKKGVQRPKQRLEAGSRFTEYDLNDSIAVAQVIREQGGGATSLEHLASFLRYRSVRSGTFSTRLAAARLFGLIKDEGGVTVPTPLAMRILAPEYPEEAQRALVEAFFSVPLYKAIHDRYKGQVLPGEAGIRNILTTAYGVPSDRTSKAYRVMMDSAEQAGFFNVRGARTHLITPIIGNTRPVVEREAAAPETDNTGSDGGDGKPPSTVASQPRPASQQYYAPSQQTPTQATPSQIRMEYVRKLIAMLGQEGIDQNELMARIERLLAIEETQMAQAAYQEGTGE